MSLFPELDEPPFPPPLVCVLDTGVLIRLKVLVKPADQFGLLNHMSTLVESGHLAFPSQVVNELSRAKYPDAPGVWIVGEVRRRVRYPQPSEARLASVLTVAEALVEADDTEPDGVADPYIAAMACEIRSTHPGCRVVVATEDYVDRMPRKLSLATACERLKLEHWRAEAFVEWARNAPDGPVLELMDPPEEG